MAWPVTGETEQLAIIGGGIQGTTLALAVARRGGRSLILEKGERPLNGASLRNEGKVHLGFVYALDESGRTTRAMVEGALTFSPLLERWCGGIDWHSHASAGFGYVVMKDGLASADRLQVHYESVLTEIERRADDFGDSYLGHGLSGAEVIRREGSAPAMVDGASDVWFSTPERAVDPRMICRRLEEAVAAEPLIEVRTGHEVEDFERTPYGFCLEVVSRSGRSRLSCGQVANCAWEGRPPLDQKAFDEQPDHCYRIKHQVVARGGDAGALMPLTLVQGPYGDLVPWPGGDVYVSWYPVSRTHFGKEPAVDLRADIEVAERTKEELGLLFPGLKRFDVVDHGPCYIMARGDTDIGDPDSGLHARTTDAITEKGGWWSLSSGKLTSAPLASERCAALMTDTAVEL